MVTINQVVRVRPSHEADVAVTLVIRQYLLSI